MFYLGGSNFPATRETLAAAVTEGLRELLVLPSGREVVRIEGGNFPAFDRVTVDLTAARSDADRLPPELRGAGQRRDGVFAARLEVAGHPLYLHQAAVDLSVSAADARFDYDRDSAGRPLLMLQQARDGRVTIQIKKQDLDSLVLVAAREAASRQGVQVVDTQTTLTQFDARSVAVDVRVKVKKMFISTTVTLRGKLRVDDTLNARVFDLACTGEGMLGELASGILRPHIQMINGQTFPLTALSLGEVRLHDLAMQVGDSVKVTAAFGS